MFKHLFALTTKIEEGKFGLYSFSAGIVRRSNRSYGLTAKLGTETKNSVPFPNSDFTEIEPFNF